MPLKMQTVNAPRTEGVRGRLISDLIEISFPDEGGEAKKEEIRRKEPRKEGGKEGGKVAPPKKELMVLVNSGERGQQQPVA